MSQKGPKVGLRMLDFEGIILYYCKSTFFFNRNLFQSTKLYIKGLKHVWDQLFTVDTIWNIGETGDIYSTPYLYWTGFYGDR